MIKRRIEMSVERNVSRENNQPRYGRPSHPRHDPNAVVTEIALYPTCKSSVRSIIEHFTHSSN